MQPHRLRTFKRSNNPAFAEKVADIVGLYMHPPACPVVLSIDEKSQIQALDRTQPRLPLKPGKCGTMTHDYKRHGTTTLFAAVPSSTTIPPTSIPRSELGGHATRAGCSTSRRPLALGSTPLRASFPP
jgi:hypothetical protein